MLFYIIFIFSLPSLAYAYLDPGTGNALLYLIFGIFGTVVYSLKGFFYKLRAIVTGREREAVTTHNVSIFSEGKNYWTTFAPIVDALIKKNEPFNYYSMDIYDPGLAIQHELMEGRYIGEGTKAFLFLNKLQSKVLLATTPNIGNSDFELKRSPSVECLVHVLHGFGDIGYYRRGSIDSYDVVITSAAFGEKSVRDIQQKRAMSSKETISLGLPYFDYLYAKKQSVSHSDKKTILIGPSWGSKSLLQVCGIEFIKQLAQLDYNIILRPHPHSFKAEKDFIEHCISELSLFSNISFDRDVDGTASMSCADILISDNSGIRYDFAFIYEKPVITLELNYEDSREYEFQELGYDWQIDNSAKIGVLLSSVQFENIADHVQSLLDGKGFDLQEFRADSIVNINSSGMAIAEWLIERGRR